MRNAAEAVATLATALVLCVSAGAAEIHDAARSGDLETVKHLLAADPELVHARDPNGATPLHLAARGVHAALVRYLVAHGADVTIRDANQVIPLPSLAYRGADDLVALVISKGADVDAVCATYGGGPAQTTLNLLVSSGWPAAAGLQGPLTRVLLRAGANPEGLDDDGSPMATVIWTWRRSTSRRRTCRCC